MNNNAANPNLDKLYKVQTLLKAAFIICSLVYQTYTLIIAIVVCLMAVYRRQKGIRFDRTYLNDALRNQYGMNILFILSFISLSSKSIFFYAPLIIHFITGINQYVSLFQSNNRFIVKYAPNMIVSLKNAKKYLMVLKSKIEFIYFIISIVLTLFNFSRLFSLLILGQFVLLKLRTSQDFNEAIGEIDAMLSNLTGKVGLGGVYDKIRGVCRSIKNRFAQ